ncbi:MAG: hypothetical protein ACR2ML_04600 [Solirubrobacteraceae bacterium]
MTAYGEGLGEPEEVPELGCRDWSAIHNFEPPGTPSLLVSAVCTVPSGGHRIELEPQVPQGINPKDLLLRLVRSEPGGPSTGALTDIEVRYAEETDFPYESVTIVPDGPSIPVKRVE